jgi:hypothetical protein
MLEIQIVLLGDGGNIGFKTAKSIFVISHIASVRNVKEVIIYTRGVIYLIPAEGARDFYIKMKFDLGSEIL